MNQKPHAKMIHDFAYVELGPVANSHHALYGLVLRVMRPGEYLTREEAQQYFPAFQDARRLQLTRAMPHHRFIIYDRNRSWIVVIEEEALLKSLRAWSGPWTGWLVALRKRLDVLSYLNDRNAPFVEWLMRRTQWIERYKHYA